MTTVPSAEQLNVLRDELHRYMGIGRYMAQSAWVVPDQFVGFCWFGDTLLPAGVDAQTRVAIDGTIDIILRTSSTPTQLVNILRHEFQHLRDAQYLGVWPQEVLEERARAAEGPEKLEPVTSGLSEDEIRAGVAAIDAFHADERWKPWWNGDERAQHGALHGAQHGDEPAAQIDGEDVDEPGRVRRPPFPRWGTA